MAYQPKILAFAGSARKGSYNKKLIKIAAEGARKAGAAVTLIDLRDYPIPLYDGDLEAEQGLSENAKKLKGLFKANDGLLISAPEYNSSMTPLLKNTLDWVSRPEEGEEEELAAYIDKVAALVSASPGRLGGLRGLIPLRAMLSNIDVLVIPDQVALGAAHKAFNEDGSMTDPKRQADIEAVGARLCEVIAKLKS